MPTMNPQLALTCAECRRPLKPGQPAVLTRRVAGMHLTCFGCRAKRGPDWELRKWRCSGCGRELRMWVRPWTHYSLPVYCCSDCRGQAVRERRKQRRRVRHVEAACAHCGESFMPTRSDAKFCGDACRQRAHRTHQHTD